MKKYLKYLITFLVGLAIFLIIIFTKGITKETETVKIFHILVDASFVPGVLLLGFGLLVVASNGGTFDMLVYGVQKLFDLFRSDVTKVKHRTFYDYRVAKSENTKGYGYLILVGIVYIIISIIFLLFYYKFA